MAERSCAVVSGSFCRCVAQSINSCLLKRVSGCVTTALKTFCSCSLVSSFGLLYGTSSGYHWCFCLKAHSIPPWLLYGNLQRDAAKADLYIPFQLSSALSRAFGAPGMTQKSPRNLSEPPIRQSHGAVKQMTAQQCRHGGRPDAAPKADRKHVLLAKKVRLWPESDPVPSNTAMNTAHMHMSQRCFSNSKRAKTIIDILMKAVTWTSCQRRRCRSLAPQQSAAWRG